jgi:hypothetical protein
MIVTAPLTIFNQLCQPLLYRFCSSDGSVFAEGTLNPCETVDLYSIPRLFDDKFYISTRLLNYTWSPWVNILGTRPFPTTEKILELVLTSLTLSYEDRTLFLPDLNIQISLLENNLRLSCPFWLSNRSGYSLEFSGSGSSDEVLPMETEASIENYITGENIIPDKRGSFGLIVGTNWSSRSTLSPVDAEVQSPEYDAVFMNNSAISPIHEESPTVTSDSMEMVADVNLKVFLSVNHFASVEVSLPCTSCILDVILHVISSSSSKDLPLKAADYGIMYWDSGDAPGHKLETSPLAEETVFSNFRNSLKVDNPTALTTGKSFSSSSSLSSLRSTPADVDDDGDILDGDVPLKCKYNMIAECSLECIPLKIKVSMLTCNRLRLCHLAELAVFRQANQVVRQSILSSRQDLRASMFGKRKTQYLAPMVLFRGLVPYNPSKLISLIPPSIYSRVSTATKWSRSINVSSPTLDNVSITTTGFTLDEKEEVYEFGLFSSKGPESFQFTKILTFVPRTILCSRVSIPLMLRSMGHADFHNHHLPPRKIQIYHPLQLMDKKLVEVCKATVGKEVKEWTGELDLSRPGITFVLLRHVDWLLRVKVEIVGGSLIVTFSEQSAQWPPYVIKNDTNFKLRFMQGSVAEVSRRSESNWISLPERSSCSYVWESPQTLSKCVLVQYEARESWLPLECVSLDEVEIFNIGRLKSQIPKLDDTVKDGFMMWRASPEASWVKVYCWLCVHIIYVFKNEHGNDLIGVIGLSRETEFSLQVVSISRIDARKDLFSSTSFRHLERFKSSSGVEKLEFPDSFFDANVMRINILYIGQYLAYFDDFDAPGLREKEALASFEVDRRDTRRKDRLSRLLLVGVSMDTLFKHMCSKPMLIDLLESALVNLTIVENTSAAVRLIVIMRERGLVTSSSPFTPMTGDYTLLLDPTSIVYLCPPSLTFEKNELDMDSLEDCAFVLNMGDEEINSFKCFSAIDFIEWITVSRHSIEDAWIKYMQGRRAVESDYSMDSFYSDVSMRSKSDGPTKVLEITEHIRKKAAMAIDTQDVPLLGSASEYGGFCISIAIEAVTVTIMDADPSELALLRLRDFNISIEQIDGAVSRIATAITVQDIQIDNQLLNPVFPLCGHPRRTRKASASEKLQLPGLLQKGDEFPSLHIFFQQKLHFESGSIAGLLSGDAQYTDLLYFDIATLWMAPLHIDIEEEVVVRFTRLCQKVRDQLSLKGGSKLTPASSSVDSAAAALTMNEFRSAGLLTYSRHESEMSSARGIHFTVLHLHPIDVVMTFRPSSRFSTTALEQSYLTVIAQLNSARICLNALIVENAFGSAVLLLDVAYKHYMQGMWRQISIAIGNSDSYEGSVGLITNIGTGVVDVFYEPIAGLLGEKDGSFLNGLSRGASSLASRTVGGTSAFASQLTGTLGKGMSLLTLDSEFQHIRTIRRLNKAKNISEGIVEGTRDLGKNIVDGVVGVVTEPYKGWESGGAMGLGLGFAKGILGIAFKPAIGVLDLASRATEGIRNTAFSDTFYDASSENMLGRFRVPRTFGANGEIIPFNAAAAAAQYVADRVTGFDRENRFIVRYHRFIYRHCGGVEEAWGMAVQECYLLLAGVDRLLLTRFKLGADMRMQRGSVMDEADVSIVWSCPVAAMHEAYVDTRGDLILRLSTIVKCEGTWHDPSPVIQDPTAKDYLTFQTLLEKHVGSSRARDQPLYPEDGLVEYDVMKKSVSGIGFMGGRSFSKQVLILRGCVLYEYTVITKVAPKMEPDEKETSFSTMDNFTYKSAVVFLKDIDYKPKSRDFTTLTYIYPLVNIISEGVSVEDSGRVAIKIARQDSRPLTALRRVDDHALLTETELSFLCFTFRTQREAVKWQSSIRKASVSPSETLSQSLSLSKTSQSYERIVSRFQRMKKNARRHAQNSRGLLTGLPSLVEDDEEDELVDTDSIVNMLAIPAASSDLRAVEDIKFNVLKYFI